MKKYGIFHYIKLGARTSPALLNTCNCVLGTWCRPAADQADPKWLYVYAILVAAVIVISLTRALAFFESTFRLECPLCHSPIFCHEPLV